MRQNLRSAVEASVISDAETRIVPLSIKNCPEVDNAEGGNKESLEHRSPLPLIRQRNGKPIALSSQQDDRLQIINFTSMILGSRSNAA